ncbi:aldo/keto reductase [Thermoactinomyces daqus]|uniref:Aldo/keto reductase n=1 Tax=Thermoactinomyces daqus TaxID=1329516 RepID=A0A7W2AGU6_9BACL|nr:aldo/keto reductase [Thermoactinomyces daqus]MBA4541996.1 aldo/keto reductase [Thermoactinomyces daqus]
MKRALEKREIPRIGAAVTFLGFGALEIGRDWGLGDGRERQKPDDRQAEKVLHAVLDAGINLIDTASAYHRSEERIVKFLSSRRHEFILATKCGEHSKEPDTYYDFSYRAVKESIDRSLKQLQTDVIDIMQIHFGPDPERVIDEGETLAAMKDAQREGKIRYLGASIDGELATRLIESGEFDVMQMGYNLLDQTNEKNIALCREKGIGVFIRSGLAAGLLSARVLPHLNEQFKHKKKVLALLELVGGNGDQLTALALQFLYRNPGISSILVGSKRPERIGQNIALLQQEISDHLLEKALEIVND